MKSRVRSWIILVAGGSMAVASELGAQVATAPGRPQPPPGMMKNMLLASGVLLVTVVVLVVIAVIWQMRTQSAATVEDGVEVDPSGETFQQVRGDPF